MKNMAKTANFHAVLLQKRIFALSCTFSIPYSLNLIQKMNAAKLFGVLFYRDALVKSWITAFSFFYGRIYMWPFSQMLPTKRDYGTGNSVKMCSNGTFLKVYIIVNRLALWEELKYASALDIIKSMLTTVPRELVEIVLPPANCFTNWLGIAWHTAAVQLIQERKRQIKEENGMKWNELKWTHMSCSRIFPSLRK